MSWATRHGSRTLADWYHRTGIVQIHNNNNNENNNNYYNNNNDDSSNTNYYNNTNDNDDGGVDYGDNDYYNCHIFLLFQLWI